MGFNDLFYTETNTQNYIHWKKDNEHFIYKKKNTSHINTYTHQHSTPHTWTYLLTLGKERARFFEKKKCNKLRKVPSPHIYKGTNEFFLSTITFGCCIFVVIIFVVVILYILQLNKEYTHFIRFWCTNGLREEFVEHVIYTHTQVTNSTSHTYNTTWFI